MYLLDTNTLIYFFKQQGHVATHLKATAASAIAIPSVVLFELEYGLLRSTRPLEQRQGIANALAAFRVLDLDYPCATAAAAVKYHLEKAGVPIGHCDQLIAGTALANNRTLITRNTREFERIPGLRVENWYDN